MVLIIRKGASKKELLEIEKKLSGNKHGFNPDKYVGTVKFKKDGLVIQKQLRDEWERLDD